MTIKNSTSANSGTYRCTAKNVVGQSECIVLLTADQGKSRVGMIVGAIIGALLLLLLLLLLLWLLICCCNKRRYQKEVANEIREDTAAPVSHPSSRASSIRSILGYRPHHVNYSLRRQYKNANQNDLSDVNSPASSVYASSRAGTQQPPRNAGVTFAPLPSAQVNTSRAASNGSGIPSSRIEVSKRDRIGGYSLRETERPGWGDINRVPSNASAPPGEYIANNRNDSPFTTPVRFNAMEDISRIPSNASDLRFGKITDNNISRMGGIPVMIPAQAREGYAV
ncbi:coxsackievirus and adenovirus receptor homolog [Protopterus annectens]|uniref:coxsackievirus and adenovirus receptor homolog n=1 Tax=Protopterus annectens TaxID=7888 RepID=UPI001CFA7060|nr:coxsackievirus and adenovirus receptor homolog [Protopterus annectens]